MARDDLEPDIRQPLTSTESLFANTNIVGLVLLGVCCNGFALIMGIIGLVICTDEKARRHALLMTIIGGITTALGFMVPVLVAVGVDAH